MMNGQIWLKFHYLVTSKRYPTSYLGLLRPVWYNVASFTDLPLFTNFPPYLICKLYVKDTTELSLWYLFWNFSSSHRSNFYVWNYCEFAYQYFYCRNELLVCGIHSTRKKPQKTEVKTKSTWNITNKVLARCTTNNEMHNKSIKVLS